MTSWLFFLTLAALGAFGQQPKPIVLIGVIENVADNEIHMRAGARSITLYADKGTQIQIETTYTNLSPLKAGNEISVRCRQDASGKLIANEIWAKSVTFRATINKLSPTSLVVSPNSKIDGTRVVFYYPDTVFGAAARGLKVGQEVQVTGLDLGNGNVDATRIAIYNTDLPARLLIRRGPTGPAPARPPVPQWRQSTP